MGRGMVTPRLPGRTCRAGHLEAFSLACFSTGGAKDRRWAG